MKYTVKEDGTILEFLEQINSGWSKKKIKSLISYDSIFINQKKVKKIEEKVKVGDVVFIYDTKKKPKDNRLHILYEDEYLIAVEKPSGMLSIKDASMEESMYQIVRRYINETSHKKLFVLHRLDKETSGVLLFSKDEKLKYRMQAHWDEYIKKREYYAVVEGKLEKKKGTIKSYLEEEKNYFVHSTTKEKGKLAITHYQVKKEKNGFSYLEVSLDTGRKNQIRVHMKECGHPVVGDKKYGSTCNPFHRLGLHASKLTFYHPIKKEEITISSKIPKELQ